MAQPQTNCPSCSAAIAGDARFCGSCGHSLTGDAPDRTPADLSGREIAGRYKLIEQLGQGGMGAVYRAQQLSLKREVAVKLLRPELSDHPGLLMRFNKEAELAAKLNHPNTVTLYDFGQDSDGSLFIAMELVPGRSLRSEIMRQGALPAARALAICSQVAASLADAHRSGIVHRDLKPDNVMLTTRGRQDDVVRVLDFGIAKLRDPGGDVTAMPQTQAGDLLGTPQYMAPEQIRGERVDGRTDVYALGAMLYEMVTGRLPFEGNTVMSILGKHLTDHAVPPSQRRPDLGVPPPIDQLVLSAMQKNPDHRPPSMEAFGEQIERLRAHLAPTAGAQMPRRTTRPPGVPLSIDEPMPAPAPAPSPTPMASPAPMAPMAPAMSPAPMAAMASPAPMAGPAPMAQPGLPAYTPVAQPAPPRPSSGPNLALWIPIAVAIMAGIIGVFIATTRSSSRDDGVAAGAGVEPGKGGVPGLAERPIEVGDLDGEVWTHPTMGYRLVVPDDYQEQAGSVPDLMMWSGEYRGVPANIGVSGVRLGGELTNDMIQAAAMDMVQNSNATVINTHTHTYLGHERLAIVYDMPATDMRWEMILYGHGGDMIAVGFATRLAAFEASADLREELFGRRLVLP